MNDSISWHVEPQEPIRYLIDYLNPDFVDEYKFCKDLIVEKLVMLQQPLFFLERIEEVPWELLFPIYEDRAYWHFQRNVLVEHLVIALHRLFYDTTDKKSLSLFRFKNRVFKNITDDNVRKSVGAKWNQKKKQFDELSNVEECIRYVRNSYVGHLDYFSYKNPNPSIKINLSDFKSLLHQGHELFNSLEIESHQMIYVWGYLDSARERRKTDIDQLLKITVSKSHLLTLPDPERPHMDVQIGLNQSQREIVNNFFQLIGIEHRLPHLVENFS